MTDVVTKMYTDMTLPPSIVTKIDVSHLVTELEKVNNYLTEATIRAETTNAKVEQPQLSDQMTDFLAQNDLKIDEPKIRDELIKQLHLLKDKVPIIHMTFAVTADPDSLHELAQWIRSSIDPRAVIEVGLQPSLVAGVYIRTPNHVHDLSLRAMLKNGRGKLVEELGALRGNR